MQVKNLIIGAGISGLTYANYCENDYLIVESEKEVGGYCRTIKKGDFVWDYAGHFFHFKSEEFKNFFLNNIPKEKIVYNEKNTKILYNNYLIDYPFQMNIHQLEKNEFIDCLYDLFNKEEKYNNFLDMLYGKFGKSIVNKFLKPYNEKLYATELTNLDVDAMGRFFPYADKEAIISNMKIKKAESYNNTFLYSKDGAGSFIQVLYNGLEKNKVLLDTHVVSINLKEKIVELSNGKKIQYEYLINTIPLNKFIILLGEFKDLYDKLSYNKVLVFNLGFDKESPLCQKEHWIYVPSKDCNFYRCGFYNNILGTKKLSMYIEIGYDKDEKITSEEISMQLDLTLKNLEKYNIISKEMKLIEHSVIIMDPAYVHINNDTNKEISLLKERLKSENVYTIGRYGAWNYSSMEDSMISAKQLARQLKKN